MKFKKSTFKSIFDLIMLLSILLLVAITQLYLFKQKLLVLESNNLLSSNHIQANNSVNSTWKSKIEENDNFWVMGTIETINDIKVVSLFASKFDDIILPINKGRVFSNNDGMESIVGEDVPTYKVGDAEIFKYNNKEYKVIGKIGLVENSPLRNTALINDSDLLEVEETTLFFDGPDVDKISWLEGEEGEDMGIERWFDITSFSTGIKNIVGLIIICSIILWVYNFNVRLEILRKLYIQTGIRLIQILRKELAYLSFIFCISIIIIFLLVDIHNVIEVIIKDYISLYFCIIVLYIILFFKKILKGKNSYD